MSFEQTHIHPFVGNDAETDIILFFTDNNGEPKKLNVRRAIEGDEAFTGNALGYEGEDLEDFITACSKTPLSPITFEFTTEYNSSGLAVESSFKNVDGLMFSYQNVHEDGFVSAPAAWSTVAYPPTITNLGTFSLSDVSVENTCRLSIPKQTQEVSRIRLLFKEGNTGTWKVIDEVSAKVEQTNELFAFTPGNTELTGVYKFKNDRVYAVLPADENKNYDALPRRAQAQTVTGNRLMYGNYEEGFDNVNARATSEVILKDRPQDLTLFNLTATPSFTQNSTTAGYEGNEGASTGFILDGSAIPEQIEQGLYEVQVSIKPSRNIHVYDTKGKGYRGSKNISISDDSLDFSAELPDIIHGSDYANPDSTTEFTPMFSNDSGAATATWKSEEGNLGGVKLGSTASAPLIFDVNHVLLKVKLNVTPLEGINRSQFMSGLFSVMTAQSGDPITALTALGIELVSVNDIEDYDATYGIFVDSFVNLDLDSGDKVSQDTALAELICAAPRPSANKVAGFFIFNKAKLKVGFESSPEFNSADGTKRGLRLKIASVSDTEILTCFPKPAIGKGNHPSTTDEAGYLLGLLQFLELGDYSGVYSDGPLKPWAWVVEEEALVNQLFWPKTDTTILGVENSGVEMPYRIGEWLLLDKEGVEANDWVDFYSEVYENIQGTDLGLLAGADALPGENGTDTVSFATLNIGAVMANFTSASLSNESLNPFESPSYFWSGYIDDFEFLSSDLNPEDEFFPGHPLVKNPFSIVDGDAGPGGRRELDRPFSDTSIGTNGVEEGLTELGPVPGAAWNTTPLSAGQPYPKYNRWGSVWSSSLLGFVENMPFISAKKIYSSVTDSENTSSADPIKKGAFDSSPVNNVDVSTNLNFTGESSSSFKTRAIHDFGIVYYDSRGRASAVNKLTSVYVPGYSSTERPSGMLGAVSIKLNLLHEPPEGATDYKIVYSNRNNVKRFIQYTAADAFVKKGTAVTKNNLYISLAHLQGHDISYSEAYGARTHDTDEPSIYRYSSGDRLRLISYYTNDDTRVWFDDSAVLDVLGVETLSDSLSDHPLYEDSETDEEKKLQRNGEFVVVKNDPSISGFTAVDIDADNDLWKNRVVFEIISPEKETLDTAQPYYETSYGGKIINGAHESESLIIEEGDVFFRGVPVNMQDYDTATSKFVNRIDADGEGNDVSQPRFERYNLETEAVTDLYSSAAKSYGKAHFVNPDARVKIQEASIRFSQKTMPNDFRIKYTSFPPLNKDFFHLPEKYGDVNYIEGKDEFVYALQESKVSMLPLDRAITATASGQQTLNLSETVLNAGNFFAQDYGPAGNPESVVIVDGIVYFVDKSNQLIARVSRSEGMQIISMSGMEEYFKRQFISLAESSNSIDLLDARIVGGYDPNEGEVMFSFLKPTPVSPIFNGLTNDNHPLSQVGPALEFIHDDEPFVNTISFDHQGGKYWKTRYSFNATNYARVNNKFISFKDVNDKLVWEHNTSELRNRFHDKNYYSMIKMASTLSNPSVTKSFKALSFEGSQEWPSIVRTTSEKAKVSAFSEREGSFYSAIGGSEGSTSTSNVMVVGTVSSVAEAVDSNVSFPLDIKFKASVNNYPVNLGESVSVGFTNPGGLVSQPIALTPVKIIDDYTIRYSIQDVDFTAPLEDSKIIHTANASIYGDNLRDKALIVSAYNNSQEPVELFAVNVESTPSKLDASS